MDGVWDLLAIVYWSVTLGQHPPTLIALFGIGVTSSNVRIQL